MGEKTLERCPRHQMTVEVVDLSVRDALITALRRPEGHRRLDGLILTVEGRVEDGGLIHVHPHARDAYVKMTPLQLVAPPSPHLFAGVVREECLSGPAVAREARAIRVLDENVLLSAALGSLIAFRLGVQFVFHAGVEDGHGAYARLAQVVQKLLRLGEVLGVPGEGPR